MVVISTSGSCNFYYGNAGSLTNIPEALFLVKDVSALHSWFLKHNQILKFSNINMWKAWQIFLKHFLLKKVFLPVILGSQVLDWLAIWYLNKNWSSYISFSFPIMGSSRVVYLTCGRWDCWPFFIGLFLLTLWSSIAKDLLHMDTLWLVPLPGHFHLSNNSVLWMRLFNFYFFTLLLRCWEWHSLLAVLIVQVPLFVYTLKIFLQFVVPIRSSRLVLHLLIMHMPLFINNLVILC